MFISSPVMQLSSDLLDAKCSQIMIVDDEKFNCDIIYGFLLVLGFKNRESRTKFAYNGEQAV
jgi:CheY-like chemotaxis protein